MTPQEMLQEAADYLAEHGWCQGNFFENNDESLDVCAGRGNAACAIGALHAVRVRKLRVLGVPVYTGIVGDAAGLLSTYLDYIPVPAWNDDPERTAEDVILALRRAAG